MEDYGVQDNKNVMKLIIEEINKNSNFAAELERTDISFNIGDFDYSDDKIKYLLNLNWHRSCLYDLIAINKYIDFTYCIFEESDALKLCSVKNTEISEFGIDQQGHYIEKIYPEYGPFKEYLKNEADEGLYNFYIEYCDAKVKQDDDKFNEGFNIYYEELGKLSENYFKTIAGHFDLAIWSEIS